MPDGTSRFKCNGKDILHFMGCSTFSQYTVVSKYSVVAIQEKAPLDKACLLGCGSKYRLLHTKKVSRPDCRSVTTGYGAATKTANVQQGDTVAVFGVGCVGLAVISGAAARKASKIIAIDTNPDKKKWADEMGATDFLNPKELQGQSTVEKLVEMTDGGLDFTLCV
jgi:S-(hydroxymethyl)glutathione dehydrogenase/alcohol dehydrogenase